MPLKGKLYISCLGFGFLAHFCSKASRGQHWAYGPKTTLKLLVHVLDTGHGPQLIAQNQSSKSFVPEPPPLKSPHEFVEFDTGKVHTKLQVLVMFVVQIKIPI